MYAIRRAISLYRLLIHRQKVEQELDAEVNAYFTPLEDRYMEQGMSNDEARRAVRLKCEGPEQVKQRVREAQVGVMLEATTRDIRHSFRLWAKCPGFALAAVAAIGLGIGANAAVFTLADAVLFKTLPFEGGGRLVYVRGVRPGCDMPCDTGRSYPDFREFQEQAKKFESLMAYRFLPANISDANGLPDRYRAMEMTTDGFSVLGQRPVAGRDFIPADERPGATPVAILTYPLWETRYAKNPSIIGRQYE